MLTTNVLCMKKRKKRRYCVSNVSDYGHQGSAATNKRSPGSAVTMMHITEDTPPDMLAGAMDLTVHLPTGRSVKMSVERSTPMMDLLVQIVTAHQLQLSGHILEALEMAPSSGISDKILPYKPNTPIGALDTQHIRVVPKNKSVPLPRNVPSGHQPFESTFRLKVHLPRNQLYVTRVSQNVYLEDIMSKVCKEKGLDPSKYEFRHPGNLDEVLDPKLTLSDYQITEIYVVSKGTGRLTQAFSTSDIMALRKEEERKQFQAKTGGGVFNLIFKRGKPNPGNGSISSENRSISPTHSDDSRSVTPPGIQPPIIKEPPITERPKPPQRKRRPAPKPPQAPVEEVKNEKPSSQISSNSQQSETSAKKAENGLLICHSRNSSDSSGYHEASILSDNCNTSLPRRPKTMIENEDVNGNKLSGEHSRSTGNLSKISVQYKSTSSLALHGRKKKAAPPPPPISTPKPETSNTNLEITSPVVASQPVENLPESISTVPTNQTPPESISSSVVPPSTTTSTTSSTRTSVTKASTSIPETNQVPNIVVETQTAPPPPQRRERIDSEDHTKQTETDISISLSESKNEADSGICEKEDLELETVWQYQLPSPPKAFRDASPAVPTISQYDTETLPDSVVTNPELFEKLQFVKDIQDAEVESDIPSVVSEEEKEICNKLTLEHLEKRKSLVYNRELATSLKFAQDSERSEDKSVEILKSDQLEDVSGGTNSDTYSNKTNTSITNTAKLQEHFKSITTDRNLPNFQISSYDAKKEKINIFEDDTIRSNSNQIATIAKLDSPPAPILDKPRNISNDDKLDSSETISSRKNSSSDAGEKHEQEVFKKPQEVSAYRLKNSFYDKNKNINATNNKSVARSGSFSMNTEIWTPTIPVKRSKSQVALNKYREDGNTKSESLSRSNSLLDVSSSLQSLEVMKKIQNKLSSSKEELDIKPQQEVHSEPPVSAEPKPIPPPKTAPPPAQVTTTWTPPSINLGTWSQRPKTQVMVKEDTDYKFSTKVMTSTTQENDLQKASTLKPTSSLNSYKSNTININNNNTHQVSNGVSIKVNGVEPISSQKSGNIVIKIGATDSNKELDGSSSRFINHFTPEGYRKPFGNVNKIERVRPHSIAFDNQFDISRVPVVRSVELKKPFKDLQNNKSITQIYSNSIKINDNEPKSLNCSNSPNSDSDLKSENKRSNVYLSNESINKPVFRNNSFTPIVKGFRTDTTAPVNRKVWSMYGTLPTKSDNNQNELNTNRNVPFSQMNLRRTESNKVLHSNAHSASNNSNIFDNVILRNSNNSNYKAVVKEFSDKSPEIPALPIPPPPPQLPKESSFKWQNSTDTADARAELFNAIRNFGGKNGLKVTKG